jgi:hypothetical protein
MSKSKKTTTLKSSAQAKKTTTPQQLKAVKSDAVAPIEAPKPILQKVQAVDKNNYLPLSEKAISDLNGIEKDYDTTFALQIENATLSINQIMARQKEILVEREIFNLKQDAMLLRLEAEVQAKKTFIQSFNITKNTAMMGYKLGVLSAENVDILDLDGSPTRIGDQIAYKLNEVVTPQ